MIEIHKKWCTHCRTKLNIFRYGRTLCKIAISTTFVWYMCRKCNTRRMKKYRETKIGRENTRKANRKNNKKHWNKTLARHAVFMAVKNGRLKKPLKCSSCNKKTNLDGHHDDYRKALDVMWVCRSCHADIHKELVVV